MMSWTHEAGALACASMVYPCIASSNSMLEKGIFFGVCAFSALIPDADTWHSKLGIILFPILWPVYVLQFIAKLFFPTLYRIIGHRGILHWPVTWVVALMTLSIYTFLGRKTVLLCAIAIGVFSHLLLDFFSTEGVAVFAPFSLKRRNSILHCKTGGLLELCIFICLCYYLLSDYSGSFLLRGTGQRVTSAAIQLLNGLLSQFGGK